MHLWASHAAGLQGGEKPGAKDEYVNHERYKGESLSLVRAARRENGDFVLEMLAGMALPD